MSETLPLAADFPAATEADWRAAVDQVLKGKPFSDLVTTTADAIEIQPLYTSGPEPDAATRGWRTGAWEVRQAASQPGQALVELESGATGLLVDGDPAELLDGVHLEMVPVSMASGGGRLVNLWDARDTPVADRAGTLGSDPIGRWARSGGRTDLGADLGLLAALTDRVADHPAAVRTYVADGTVWHEAGATPAQELAWNVAAAIAIVREVPDVAGRLELRWSVDADQFTSIAKLRAARQLWARVAQVASLPQRAFHHAEVSRAMLTRYDTWTNALRSTVACFAAGVGGADAVTVWPHDLLVEPGGSELGRRVARNTQTILQSESHLSRVLDIAGGSFFVESLTAELAAAAWAEIQRIDGLGGLIAAVEGGHVHAALDPVLTERSRRIATRRQPLTGLSEFPDIGEPAPPPLGAAAPVAADCAFAPFGMVRLSEGFEAQRARADQAERTTGERPSVYLAQLGSLAQSTARTTFAKNLFEAAGIRTVAGPVDDFPGGVACLCSSDAIYAEQATDAVAALRAAGATRLYVAGRKLNLDGVDEEIGVGSDVLDVLTRALDHLGAPA